jgi:HEPN domain-containing protein
VLSRSDLKKIAQARLEDAEALLKSQRYDGAVYLCGYAVELALKARICLNMGWSGYPSTRPEFQKYQSFKTHDLDVLLHLSGAKAMMLQKLRIEWSAVAKWEPEARYKPVGSTTRLDAKLMIESAKIIVRALI